MPWRTHYPKINKEIPVVNAGLSEFCAENQIRFVDTYSHFIDENGVMREDLSDDGIHPNYERGYKVLTKLINEEIQRIEQAEDADIGEKQ